MELFKRENILKRIRPFYQDSSFIKVITGIRRCGKSSIMKLISQELEENNKVPSPSILFLDLLPSLQTTQQARGIRSPH